MAFEVPAVVGGVSAVLSGLGFEGTETVANPRAGLDAGFLFFLLFGGIMRREGSAKSPKTTISYFHTTTEQVNPDSQELLWKLKNQELAGMAG